MAKKKFRTNKYWWVSCREKIVFLVVLAVMLIISPQKPVPTEAAPPVVERPQITYAALPLPSPAPYPVNTTGILPSEAISAYSIVVVDVDSGVIMFQRNAEEPMAPASTTKLMTAMVALDTYNPEDVITVQEATLSGQVMDLVPGEKMTVENLLYGLLVPSANDAAYVLAQAYPQGPENFMLRMNEKAQEMGLKQTNFVNPAGFDDDAHKMSAKDIATVARFALQYPLITKIVGIPQITVSDVSHSIFHNLRTTNLLLGRIPGVAGFKTGTTQAAGENLVTLIERDGRKVVIVALRSTDRFGDTESLINWAFSNHQWMSYGM